MVALKQFRHSGPSFSDLLPYAGLVDNGVLLLKDGSLMAGWYFAGPDSESSTDIERNEISPPDQRHSVPARVGLDDPGRGRARTGDGLSRTRTTAISPIRSRALIDDERRAHFEAADGHYREPARA